MTKLLLISLAGALGTLARFLIVEAASRRLGATFPWGTLLVNLLGSFAFGLIWAASDARGALSPGVRVYALGGFMGAFTTFSSLMFDVSALVSGGRTGAGVLDLVLQNLLGLCCLALGLVLGRAV